MMRCQKSKTGFHKVISTIPFDYKFVDEEYGLKFAEEERIGKLATFFAVLAIIISCLGLFGLVSYVAEQRTKEIGIRKVLGASVFSLWQLLSKQFVTLVIISCFIAVPLAWYFLNGWLQKYEYRINMSWWIFAVAVCCCIIDHISDRKFPGYQSGDCKPCEVIANGVKQH